jgi:hypothetical protein
MLTWHKEREIPMQDKSKGGEVAPDRCRHELAFPDAAGIADLLEID